MTIVAGFKAIDGMLLCADTLYSDGQTKLYRDKIFTVPLKYGMVVFALAGNASIGRMAFEDCKAAIKAARRKDSVADILRVIRPVVRAITRSYVLELPFEERDTARFEFLIAIATRSENALFSTGTGGSIEPVDEYECLGSGRHLGHYIIQSGYRRDIKVDEAVVISIRALAAAKKHVDGCGGKSQFLRIHDGFVSPVVPYDVNSSETAVQHFESEIATMLLAVGDGSYTADEFKQRIGQHCKALNRMRDEWTQSSVSAKELLAALFKVA